MMSLVDIDSARLCLEPCARGVGVEVRLHDVSTDSV